MWQRGTGRKSLILDLVKLTLIQDNNYVEDGRNLTRLKASKLGHIYIEWNENHPQ